MKKYLIAFVVFVSVVFGFAANAQANEVHGETQWVTAYTGTGVASDPERYFYQKPNQCDPFCSVSTKPVDRVCTKITASGGYAVRICGVMVYDFLGTPGYDNMNANDKYKITLDCFDANNSPDICLGAYTQFKVVMHGMVATSYQQCGDLGSGQTETCYNWNDGYRGLKSTWTQLEYAESPPDCTGNQFISVYNISWRSANGILHVAGPSSGTSSNYFKGCAP